MSFTLAQLARNAAWTPFRVPNLTGTSRAALSPDEIAISIMKKKAQKGSLIPQTDIKMYVTIRMGIEIFTKMGWKYKDNICVFHHPDDLLSFMLVKSTTGKKSGYTTYKEVGTTGNARMNFRWNRPFIIEEVRPQVVDYLHVESNNSIVFRIAQA